MANVPSKVEDDGDIRRRVQTASFVDAMHRDHRKVGSRLPAVALLLAASAGCAGGPPRNVVPPDDAASLVDSDSGFVAATGRRMRLTGTAQADKDGPVLDTAFARVSLPGRANWPDQLIGRRVALVGQCETFVPAVQYTPEGIREQRQERANADGTPARVYLLLSAVVLEPSGLRPPSSPNRAG
jgi:hypothetical protein